MAERDTLRSRLWRHRGPNPSSEEKRASRIRATVDNMPRYTDHEDYVFDEEGNLSMPVLADRGNQPQQGRYIDPRVEALQAAQALYNGLETPNAKKWFRDIVERIPTAEERLYEMDDSPEAKIYRLRARHEAEEFETDEVPMRAQTGVPAKDTESAPPLNNSGISVHPENYIIQPAIDPGTYLPDGGYIPDGASGIVFYLGEPEERDFKHTREL